MAVLSSEKQNIIKNSGKHVMQIMTMQCQSLYTQGMTESAFIETVYGNITASNRTIESVNFFNKVYEHLSLNHSSSDIESLETGEVTLNIYQKAIECPSRTYQNAHVAINAIIKEDNEQCCISPIIWFLLFLLAILLSGDSRKEEKEK